MISIEQAAITTPLGEEPPYSPHGYCITQDGTCYALLHRFWHGALLAMLYPEQAAEAGYILPDEVDELNVYEFQKFELDNHDHFPVIRVCPSRMLGPTSVDRGAAPSTPEQVEAMRNVIKALGLTAHDEISTDHRDMEVHEMIDFLINDNNVYSDTPREHSKPHRLIKKDEDKYDVLDAEQTIEPKVASLPDDDGFGEWRPQSFEEAAGIVRTNKGRNDE